MPTAAKLVGGVALGLTAMLAGYYFMLEQSDYRISINFVLGNFPVGFFVGWYSLGREPGHNNRSGIANGVRAVVMLLIASALVFSLFFIFANLKQNNFKDPMDMVLLWIKTSFEYAVLAMTRNVALTLLFGGAISGWLTYQASRRWT